MKTLLIIEQPLWREAMSGVLRGVVDDGEICAVAGLEEALHLLADASASLVLTAAMVQGLADQGLSQLVAAAAPAPVVVLSGRYDPTAAQRAADAGARAYIPMTDSRDLICAALRVAAAGGLYFPRAPEASAQASRAPGRLSPRQREVLDQLLQGRTNREIADALGIALPTVKLHVHAILRASGARNRTEAVLLARDGRLSVN